MTGKTKGIVVYLAVAFGMAWVLWEIPLRFGLSPRSPLLQLAALPGAFAPAVAAIVVPIQLLVTALLATPILWGEEFGWRGYLQVRLLGQHPLLAAVATGLIWGVWHYPINLRGYNFPGHPVLGLVVFPVSTILLSIMFGWLRLRTGSVWAASLAHAATNAVGGSLITLLFAGGPDSIFVGYLGLLGWLPLGVLCAWIVFSGQLRSGMVTPCSGT
jgi:membrane protease YdiL (CAAX protease family)